LDCSLKAALQREGMIPDKLSDVKGHPADSRRQVDGR